MPYQLQEANGATTLSIRPSIARVLGEIVLVVCFVVWALAGAAIVVLSEDTVHRGWGLAVLVIGLWGDASYGQNSPTAIAHPAATVTRNRFTTGL